MISIRNAKFAKIGLQDMINHIGDASKKVIVELGCYVGDSTEIFAKNFKQVIAVDPWQNGYDDTDAASYQHDMKIIEKQFDEMKNKYTNIKKIKMKSEDAIQLFRDNSIDVVYIDALHTYLGVKKDIATWESKIKPGGFLCGHDYQPRFSGVIEAVNERKKPDATFRDTSWLIEL